MAEGVRNGRQHRVVHHMVTIRRARHLLGERRRRTYCPWHASQRKQRGAVAVAAVQGPADLVELAKQAAEWLRDLPALVEPLLNAAGAKWVAVATLGAAMAWAAARWQATRRALQPARRTQLMALPTETFDPSAEEVARYAAQLSRTRRTVRGSLTRTAQAVRVRLDSVGNGHAIYRIEGAASAASILRLAGFGEVELRPADAVDDVAMGLLDALPPASNTDGLPQSEEFSRDKRAMGNETSNDS